jgi:hypothetical protein
MDRWKQGDEPLAIERGVQREVDPHHADREDVDRDVHQLEDAGRNASQQSAQLIVRGLERAVIAGRPDEIAKPGHPVSDLVDARFPAGDEARQREKELPCLIDHRRHEHPGQQHERADGPENGREEGNVLGRAQALLNPVGQRAQIERDENAEQQEHEYLSDGLEHP